MCYETATLVINIFIALGTVGAVLWVLYKDVVKAHLNRAILNCDLEDPPLYSTKLIRPDGYRPIQYCRLRIHNTGKASLKTVEVMITNLMRKDGNNFIKVDKFSPDNLIWSFLSKEHLIPLGNEKIHVHREFQVYCPFISPGTTQLCNLGNIIDEQTQMNNIPIYSDKIFELNVRFKSSNLHYLLTEGLYQLEITVGAENARAIKKYYEMNISESDFLIKEIPRITNVS